MSDESKVRAESIPTETKVLTSAPPPLHTVAFVGACTAIFVMFLPSIDSLDESATVATFTKIIFPEYVDLQILALVRAAIAGMIFLTTLFSTLSPGFEILTPYEPASRLVSKPFRIKGIRTTFSFTSVSWNILGLAFSCSSYVAFRAANTLDDAALVLHPWFLRISLCLWEISAPFTILVSAVVRYAIWPASLNAKNQDDGTAFLKLPRPLIMHNANILAALTEISLLGGLPVLPNHGCLAPLLGTAYILFTWWMATRWASPDIGPQFMYHFFDTTLPGYRSTAAVGALMAVLFLSYGVFCGTGRALESLGGSLSVHVAFVVGVASLVVRFRD